MAHVLGREQIGAEHWSGAAVHAGQHHRGARLVSEGVRRRVSNIILQPPLILSVGVCTSGSGLGPPQKCVGGNMSQWSRQYEYAKSNLPTSLAATGGMSSVCSPYAQLTFIEKTAAAATTKRAMLLGAPAVSRRTALVLPFNQIVSSEHA